jgi:hypothetical protein
MEEFWSALDASVGTAFLALTLCAYAVKYIPLLSSISDHGKQAQLSTHNSLEEYLQPGIAQWIGHLRKLTVHKSLFTALYLYGFVFVAAVQFTM